jgi:hypothetical protein
MIISKHDFKLLHKKMSTKLSSNVSQKDEIIYFSDTQDHALYSKDKLLIRMRWRNQ